MIYKVKFIFPVPPVDHQFYIPATIDKPAKFRLTDTVTCNICEDAIQDYLLFLLLLFYWAKTDFKGLLYHINFYLLRIIVWQREIGQIIKISQKTFPIFKKVTA